MSFSGLYQFLGSNYVNRKTGDVTANPNDIIAQNIHANFTIEYSNAPQTYIVCEKIDPTKMEYSGTYPASTKLDRWFGDLQTSSNIFTVSSLLTNTLILNNPAIIEYATSTNTPNDRDATCNDSDGPWLPSLAAAGTGNVTKMRIKSIIPAISQSARIAYNGYQGVKIKPTFVSGIAPAWLSSSYDNGTTWRNYNQSYSTGAYGSLDPTNQYYGVAAPIGDIGNFFD
jgi:hypothetical protein